MKFGIFLFLKTRSLTGPFWRAPLESLDFRRTKFKASPLAGSIFGPIFDPIFGPSPVGGVLLRFFQNENSEENQPYGDFRKMV